VALWFSGSFCFKIYDYFSLSVSQPLEQIDWEIQEIKKDHYVIHSNYLFIVDGKESKGKGYLSQSFPNYWAAQNVLKSVLKKQWTVWYNPLNLKQTALEKIFPTNALISALVLIGIFIYFISLGYYVGRWEKTGRK